MRRLSIGFVGILGLGGALGLVLPPCWPAYAQQPDQVEGKLGAAYQRFEAAETAANAGRVHLADAIGELIEARRAEQAAQKVAAGALAEYWGAYVKGLTPAVAGTTPQQ